MMPNDKISNDKIFIIVPAYNEGKTIRHVIGELLQQYPHVVVIDDGSSDNTSESIRNLKVFLIKHIINCGQGASLQTGFDFCLLKGAEIIVTFDADGQHDSSDIRRLIEPLLTEKCDVTLGSRFLGHAHNIPLSRKIMLKLGILFTRGVSGIKVTDVHNGLRAFSRKAAESLHINMDRMGHASEILDQIKIKKLRFREVPVNVFYSKHSLGKGQSSWNAIKIALEFLYGKISR